MWPLVETVPQEDELMQVVSGVFVKPHADLAGKITKRRGHAMNIALGLAPDLRERFLP
jgi:hypothetical protein